MTEGKSGGGNDIIHVHMCAGLMAGRRSQPYPFQVAFITEDGGEFATTFKLTRPWDSSFAAELKAADVPVDFNLAMSPESMAELYAQNVFVATRLLPRDCAWDKIPRPDGTFWVYERPGDDIVDTDQDPRVELAADAMLMQLIKTKAVQIAFGTVRATEKNSENSSEPTTDPKPQPTAKRRSSQKN